MPPANATVWTPYCGVAPVPAHAWTTFNLDPWLILALLAVLGLAAKMKSAAQRRDVILAVAVAALLFISPFCALGSALFSARVVHHLALVLVLAPLLAGLDVVTGIARRISLPVLTAAHVLVFWAWHAPPFYAAALSNDAIFWAMQLTLVGSAALWWARIRQADAGSAAIALLAAMVLMGLLAALLVFASSAFYAPHWLTTQSWGLSPLQDQQLGGLLMWVPGSAAYLLIALALLYRSLRAEPA